MRILYQYLLYIFIIDQPWENIFSFLMVAGLSKSGIKNTVRDFLYEMFIRPQNFVWRNTVDRKYMQFQIVQSQMITNKASQRWIDFQKISCLYILYFKQYVLYEILPELGKTKYTVTFKVVFYFRINFW